MSPSKTTEVGAIFAIPLRQGLFGACLVIEKVKEPRLVRRPGWRVAVLDGTWAQVPALDTFQSRSLNVSFMRRAWLHPGRVLGGTVEGEPPQDWAPIGITEVTWEDRLCLDDLFDLYDDWLDFGEQVLREWRWIHERKELQVDELRESKGEGLQKKLQRMSERDKDWDRGVTAIEKRLAKVLPKGAALEYSAYETDEDGLPVDNLDQVAVEGRCIFLQQAEPPFGTGKNYVSAEVQNPTWIQVCLLANEMIEITRDRQHVFLEGVHVVSEQNGIKMVDFVMGS